MKELDQKMIEHCLWSNNLASWWLPQTTGASSQVLQHFFLASEMLNQPFPVTKKKKIVIKHDEK